MSKIRWIALILFTGLLIGLAVASAPRSDAAASAGVPFIDVCPKNAPFAATPEAGLAGMMGERPLHITTDNSPEHIWSTGGFAGLRSHVYDLGCAADPTSWMRIAGASSDSKMTNALGEIGDGLTALTDSVDRRAWQPGFITSFLKDFASRATGVIEVEIVIPFLALGIILAVGLLLWRSHGGEMGAAATGVGWIFVVITITGLILLTPLLISTTSQQVGGGLVGTLNNGSSPSDAQTNQIVKNVQYQSWLRRNFGSTDTAVGTTYGPDLLASTRVSWAEMDAIEALPLDRQSAAREALTEKKAEQFKAIAAKIKEADSTAYKYLTGEESSSVGAAADLAFVVAGNAMRLMVALLMITATLTIFLLGIIWTVATPVLILPRIGRFTGQEMGMNLINGAVRAVAIVMVAAVGSWLFGVFLQAALAAPTMWWSLLLLIIGTGIAWAVIGPIEKFKAIVTLGRSDGRSILARYLGGLAMAYVGGRIGGRAAGREINEHDDEPVVERLSEDTPSPKVVYANVYTPTAPFRPEQPTTVDAEPLQGKVVHTLPTGPAYERGPAAPPDAAGASPYEPYERTDDHEGASK